MGVCVYKCVLMCPLRQEIASLVGSWWKNSYQDPAPESLGLGSAPSLT
jgi:hypothetical protein